MISFYKIKPKFQKLLKPILVGLYKFGITANQITVSSIVLSFFIGISLWFHTDYRWGLLVVPIGLLVRMALNALDGMMARTYNMQSKLGEVSPLEVSEVNLELAALQSESLKLIEEKSNYQ